MMVHVPMNVTIDPSAPSTPTYAFQKPRRSNVPNVSSDVPRKKPAPRTPNTGSSQKTRGLWLMSGTSICAV